MIKIYEVRNMERKLPLPPKLHLAWSPEDERSLALSKDQRTHPYHKLEFTQTLDLRYM